VCVSSFPFPVNFFTQRVRLLHLHERLLMWNLELVQYEQDQRMTYKFNRMNLLARPIKQSEREREVGCVGGESGKE